MMPIPLMCGPARVPVCPSMSLPTGSSTTESTALRKLEPAKLARTLEIASRTPLCKEENECCCGDSSMFPEGSLFRDVYGNDCFGPMTS